MSVFRRCVLHRIWIPAVVIVTLAVFIPRARAASERMSRVSRAAGVYGAGSAEPNQYGTTGFRWMKRRAALHEPVRGRELTLQLYVGRPGIETDPLVVHITIAGTPVQPIVLHRAGWLTPTYDLVVLLGEARWKSLSALAVAFEFERFAPAPSSHDWGLPGIGLGYARWSGPSPH